MPQRFTILIPDVLDNADIEEEVFGDEYRILTPKALEADEIPAETWAETDAVLAFHELSFTSEVLEGMPRCKVVVRNGVGYDNVDLKAAGELGILVCNIPDYGTDSVADHTMGCLLALARRLTMYTESIREGAWKFAIDTPPHRLGGTVLGIVGMGRIGTATALRAKAFGLDVRFYDPYVPDGTDKALQVTRCDTLHELLAEADYVSMHCLLCNETREMANAEFFGAMKDGAIFINTARGGVLDVEALTDALRSEKLLAAAIDVWPNEPPKEGPLVKAWKNREPWIANRLLVTPHAAFFCVESIEEMRIKGAKEVMRVLSGTPPRNCVNPQFITHVRAGDHLLPHLHRNRPL